MSTPRVGIVSWLALALAAGGCGDSEARADIVELRALLDAQDAQIEALVVAATAEAAATEEQASGDADSQVSINTLERMAQCLTDTRQGSRGTTVSHQALERCALVGLGEAEYTARPNASDERVAECYEACASLRTCARNGRNNSRWDVYTCVRRQGEYDYVGGGYTVPRFSPECLACREEAPRVRQDLGVEAVTVR